MFLGHKIKHVAYFYGQSLKKRPRKVCENLPSLKSHSYDISPKVCENQTINKTHRFEHNEKVCDSACGERCGART